MLALSDSVDVRAESLTSVSENYITLQQTWDAAREATKDTEVRTRIAGVAAQMEKFEFFYGLELERKILNMMDYVSRSLQGKYMCASDGQKLVQITLSALQLMRTDNDFKLFWHYVEQRKSKVAKEYLLQFLQGIKKFPSALKLVTLPLNNNLVQLKTTTEQFTLKQ